jgi:mRNA interferase RelE/StbE
MDTVRTVLYTTEAVRQIEKLTGKTRTQVERAIAQIAAGERRGKMLRGELFGTLSERVGNHRILYREEGGVLTVLIVAVVHRRIAYGGH